ncbi:MFS transporter/fungal specific transcription factor domain-containing protein [Aspergillus udagawae]|uniref:Xylanolytic transcriptional activator regulatory domain-containing protein n=1 Tax=Aspergillus udagawae TaxID=91492 RepID=A0A8E0V2C2_9EURO|nr:uncharacterized protein Aud_001841 [Aspergillus udagawae]GIC94512.1 hypothetical protein Aud_001841 [Aspergillus udagawae]
MDENDYQTIKGVFESIGLRHEDLTNGDQTAPIAKPVAEASENRREVSSQSDSRSQDISGTGNDTVMGLQPALTGTNRDEARVAHEPVLHVSLELGSTHLETSEHLSVHSYDAGSPQPPTTVPDDASPNATSALLELADSGPYHSAPNVTANGNVPPPEISEEEDDDEVTNQLSCRLGRLQVTHDGQLRYFGSTSNLTLLDVLVGVAPSGLTSTQRETQQIIENAELSLPVDEEFEQHLLQLYFTWQDPCLHVVSEEIFWRSRAQKKRGGLTAPCYSHALSDAMCAVGAAYESRYHPNLVTFPRSLAEFFGDRAKILLEPELENPSLATIQALVILSSYEASCTRDTRGWLYSGMAMRLAFDLGLHLDMAPYVERGTIRSEDAEVRCVTFWGVYMSEQFWSYYLGRPTRSPVERVTVPKPGCGDALSTLKWKPYGSPDLSKNIVNLPNPLAMICYQWISLYHLMLPLTDVLYGCCEVSKHHLQELTSDTVEKLRIWKLNLPPELNIYGTAGYLQPLPHVLALHMQYHQLLIHCHRPYISRHHIQPQPPQGPGSSHARMMCVESAIAIAKLLTLYERYYSFRRANFQIVSFIFSSALILIFSIVPIRHCERDRDLVAHLNTCFRALDEMGSQFENAKRTSTFLSTLQREWQTRRRSKLMRGVKRKFDSVHESGSSGFMPWNGSMAYGEPESSQLLQVLRESTRTPAVDSVFGSYADEPSYAADFLESDLCNILLSEGIPKAFVYVVLQATSFHVAQIIIARFIEGLGNSVNTTAPPVWQSEMLKSSRRGCLIVLQLALNQLGNVTAQWLNFGLNYIDHLGVSWRHSIAFQIFDAAATVSIIPSLPDSPRWLIQK